MRYKFRAWDKHNKRWIDRVLVGCDSDGTDYVCNLVWHEESADWTHFDEHCGTVVQWTGLTDRNGKEIYEADQLFALGNLTEELEYIGNVVWDDEDARWEVVNFHGRYEYVPNKECVVNGNIYENSELKGE